jgi:hypothetical protein
MNEKFLRNSAMFMTALNRAIGDPTQMSLPGADLPNPFTVGDDVASTMRSRASFGTASTGAPIRGLQGIARDNSIDAQLGGGSLRSGGGGVEAGRLAVSDASRSATKLAVAGWGIDLAARVAVPCAIAAAEVIRFNRAEKKAQQIADDQA